jgi:hypothetical protein
MSIRSDVNTARRLGPSEHYFWLSNQANPKHFVMAARIAGPTEVAAWRRALDAVQRRHPLLRVCISAASPEAPEFRYLSSSQIPLRVMRCDTAPDWQREMAKELATPLLSEDMPLVRAVLMHEVSGSTIILAMHHAIADGLSIALVVRDLLQALSGAALGSLPISGPQEEMTAVRLSGGEVETPPDIAPQRRPAQRLRRDRSSPAVHGLRLSAEMTARLRERARSEQTTVHAALVTALVLAGRLLSGTWREAPVRVISPVSTRKIVGLNDDCVLSIVFPLSVHDPQGVTVFWDAARRVTSDLKGLATQQSVAATFSAFRQLTSGSPDVQSIAQFELQTCACEMLLSNLGVLPFGPDFGGLTLEAFWGPSVLVGIEGEQMIGAATLHGALHLLHSSYAPIESLLQTTERTLLDVL